LSIEPHKYEYADDVLEDRIILITGASDGIGKALALHAASLGAQIILHGRNSEKLEAVYDDIEAIDGAPRPSIAVLDLATATGDDYAALGKSIDDNFGRLDGLVHNAAILGQRLSIEQYDPGEWQKVMHVNLTAPFVLTQLLLPLLRNSADASIVFTSSGVGRVGKAFWGAYSASKFGIESLSQMVAAENEHSAVRSNCINPGPVRTRMRLEAYPAEDRDKVPTANEVLAGYIFLLGPDSKGITGQSFDVQGIDYIKKQK
jgi:NAD(P)-dependent dehydrogenase (short-subunit alcohol dehydrogenase family)